MNRGFKMDSIEPSFDWQSIAPCGCRPVYGFHEVENGFVWSTFSFGLFIPSDGECNQALVLFVHNPHIETTLTCRISGVLFSTQVPPGEQRVEIPAEWAGKISDFQIAPKILLASDVRELGLLFHRMDWKTNPGNECCKFSRLEGLAAVERNKYPEPLERLQTAGATVTHKVLEGFLKKGWFKVSHGNDAFQLQLHVPSWHGSAGDEFLEGGNALKCKVSIGSNEEEIIFNRDPGHRNIYRAELPLRQIIGKNSGLLDCTESIDITLQPNAFSDYRLQSAHWRGLGRGALPNPGNIFRVAGTVGLENFLLHGASWFVKLDRIAEAHIPGGLPGCSTIVDWGCGCARISRHFSGCAADKLVGYDIDPVNVDWCRKNIPGGHFELCSVDPCLALDNDSVDVLFAHSVLTHLGEEDQNRWLEEISRVLHPGGIACLTVLAELSWYARFFPRGQPLEAVADFLDKGFINHGWLKEVGVDSMCPGAYVNSSHSEAYVLERWGKWFEILDWIDGFADLQSLVVLRKKSAPQ